MNEGSSVEDFYNTRRRLDEPMKCELKHRAALIVSCILEISSFCMHAG